ncbi:hypothetical protein [Listeria booriae]|uniref:hypothetical protein n=1 Tax=Listeria booriae TaxID=1552123 RepID=UPI001623E74A|nr:hypothetical protein [Listeria booriae]MBC1233643.1 hypothetical protein [Listeria booriae]
MKNDVLALLNKIMTNEEFDMVVYNLELSRASEERYCIGLGDIGMFKSHIENNYDSDLINQHNHKIRITRVSSVFLATTIKCKGSDDK